MTSFPAPCFEFKPPALYSLRGFRAERAQDSSPRTPSVFMLLENAQPCVVLVVVVVDAWEAAGDMVTSRDVRPGRRQVEVSRDFHC